MKIKGNKTPKFGMLAVAICLVFFFERCMMFRVTDRKAKAAFASKGIAINFNEVNTESITMHYAKTGMDTLPTLFFVHGSPGSWEAFKQYMMDTALLQHFRIISVDRPGFGYSNFGEAMHLKQQASLIQKVVEQEDNGKKVHLVGHSIGGPVIVQMAQQHPELYASITILSGSISPHHEPKEYWRYLFWQTPLQLLMPGALRPSNIEIIYFKKDLWRLDSGYAVLTMPVTFIHGDADKFVAVKNVTYGLQKLAHNNHIKIIIIPGANHFIPWQQYAVIKTHLLTLGLGKKVHAQ